MHRNAHMVLGLKIMRGRARPVAVAHRKHCTGSISSSQHKLQSSLLSTYFTSTLALRVLTHFPFSCCTTTINHDAGVTFQALNCLGTECGFAGWSGFLGM